jgi:N-acetylglucosaminyldiphosphoundecaprenol N-acetyl-beta-D-mannosaminyltransferase
MMQSTTKSEEFSSRRRPDKPPIELAPRKDRRIIIGGIPVNALDNRQWCDVLLDDWRTRRPGDRAKVVTTVNGQVLSLFASNSAYRRAILAADKIAADGMSIVKASRKYVRQPLPERVATTDWFHEAARVAERQGLSFYIIGATREVNNQAIAAVKALYPRLKIAGHRDGYFSDDEIKEIAADVDRSGADVLWLGIGNPRQLLVAHKFADLLTSATWVRTCGGLFDHLAGSHARAPKLVQRLGFEWAWRVALEPRRLFWRYLTTNIHAIYQIHKYSERSR